MAFRRYAEGFEIIERVEFRVPYGELDGFFEWCKDNDYSAQQQGRIQSEGDSECMVYIMDRVRRERHAEQLGMFGEVTP